MLIFFSIIRKPLIKISFIWKLWRIHCMKSFLFKFQTRNSNLTIYLTVAILKGLLVWFHPIHANFVFSDSQRYPRTLFLLYQVKGTVVFPGLKLINSYKTLCGKMLKSLKYLTRSWSGIATVVNREFAWKLRFQSLY